LKLLKAFILAVSLSPAMGFAGLLIEPYLSYAALKYSGSTNYEGLKTDLNETDLTGPIYGARLAYGIGNLGFGFDYSKASLNDAGNSSAMTNMCGFGMLSWDSIRFWAGYIFDTSRTIKNTDYSIDNTIKGTGLKAGLGWSLTSYFSINVEYLSLDYKKEDSSSLSDLNEQDKGFLVGISVPYVL